MSSNEQKFTPPPRELKLWPRVVAAEYLDNPDPERFKRQCERLSNDWQDPDKDEQITPRQWAETVMYMVRYFRDAQKRAKEKQARYWKKKNAAKRGAETRRNNKRRRVQAEEAEFRATTRRLLDDEEFYTG